MTLLSDMLELARRQIGYREGKTPSGSWNNVQKYSPEVPGLEWSQGQAWCSTFVSWLALKAGLSEYYPRTASTDAGALWFKTRKQWSEEPSVGAWGFLGVNGDMYHVFLVERFDDNYVYTIEGNTNTSGSSQGDGVYANKRPRNYSRIEGYGFPVIPAPVVVKPPKVKAHPAQAAIDNFKEIRRKAKVNGRIKRVKKAQAQIKQIKETW